MAQNNNILAEEMLALNGLINWLTQYEALPEATKLLLNVPSHYKGYMMTLQARLIKLQALIKD
mgnify:CR=1 FL=1|jgi:hypothetical protein